MNIWLTIIIKYRPVVLKGAFIQVSMRYTSKLLLPRKVFINTITLSTTWITKQLQKVHIGLAGLHPLPQHNASLPDNKQLLPSTFCQDSKILQESDTYICLC